MKREEAKEILEIIKQSIPDTSATDSERLIICDALDTAIQLLESEPVLDKIRTEIADLDDADYDYEGYYKAVTDALQVIDKYRREG